MYTPSLLSDLEYEFGLESGEQVVEKMTFVEADVSLWRGNMTAERPFSTNALGNTLFIALQEYFRMSSDLTRLSGLFSFLTGSMNILRSIE